MFLLFLTQLKTANLLTLGKTRDMSYISQQFLLYVQEVYDTDS